MAGRSYWLYDEPRRLKRVACRSQTPQESCVSEFLQRSSLHGVRHIVSPRRHAAEKIFWLAVLMLATAGAAALISTNYQRFYANPTVVSLEKDYRQWFSTFPAVTMCQLDRVNETAASQFIQEHWGDVNKSLEMYYMQFIKAVTNITFHNFHIFEDFIGDPSLVDIDMEELAYQVRVRLEYQMMLFLPRDDMELQPVTTELGVCYSWGSNITRNLSRYQNAFGLFSHTQCHFLNTVCYGRITLLQGGAVFFIHSPFEVPNILEKPQVVKNHHSVSASFTTQEILASLQLRSLRISQRGCVFPEETKRAPFSADSYNLCKMRCRRDIALGLCGCVPYFYRALGKGPVCNADGLVCLSRKGQVHSAGHMSACVCLPQCAQLNYVLKELIIEEWLYPGPELTSFRWDIQFSKIRFRRNVIFTFEDLLVSFGGIAGLFLGSSLLSAVEIVYFFTLRLICRYRRSNQT